MLCNIRLLWSRTEMNFKKWRIHFILICLSSSLFSITMDVAGFSALLIWNQQYLIYFSNFRRSHFRMFHRWNRLVSVASLRNSCDIFNVYFAVLYIEGHSWNVVLDVCRTRNGWTMLQNMWCFCSIAVDLEGSNEKQTKAQQRENHWSLTEEILSKFINVIT